MLYTAHLHKLLQCGMPGMTLEDGSMCTIVLTISTDSVFSSSHKAVPTDIETNAPQEDVDEMENKSASTGDSTECNVSKKQMCPGINSLSSRKLHKMFSSIPLPHQQQPSQTTSSSRYTKVCALSVPDPLNMATTYANPAGHVAHTYFITIALHSGSPSRIPAPAVRNHVLC
jgi:hypothetical protein